MEQYSPPVILKLDDKGRGGQRIRYKDIYNQNIFLNLLKRLLASFGFFLSEFVCFVFDFRQVRRSGPEKLRIQKLNKRKVRAAQLCFFL